MQGQSPAIGAVTGLDEAYRLCRQQGLRLSRQRRLVLEILWRSGEHLSARDIFDRLNSDGRRIGHTSVYQNLESLHSNGVIECLEKAQGRLYGHRSDPHSHLTDLRFNSADIIKSGCAWPDTMERKNHYAARYGCSVPDVRGVAELAPDRRRSRVDLTPICGQLGRPG